MVKNVPCFIPYFNVHVCSPSAPDLGYSPFTGIGAVQGFGGLMPGFVEPLTVTTTKLPGQDPIYTATLSLITMSSAQTDAREGFNNQNNLKEY